MKNHFFLTVQSNALIAQYEGKDGRQVERTLYDWNDYSDWLIAKALELNVPVGHLNIYCSSTVDFPDEYTGDERVIDLCRQIRS